MFVIYFLEDDRLLGSWTSINNETVFVLIYVFLIYKSTNLGWYEGISVTNQFSFVPWDLADKHTQSK